MSTDKTSKDWYDENANKYAQHVRNLHDSTYHSLYEKPAMYSLLPDLHNMSVVSLGCGSGEDCQYLNKQGALSVDGIDISSRLIKIAKNSYPECHFKVMDMESLKFKDASFDFAFSSLAIHYIEDWTKTFGEVYRVLKPGSYFLFSCNHPVCSSMETIKNDQEIKIQQFSRTRNKSANTVTIVGSYLSRKKLTSEGDWNVTTWRKSIGEISSEATSAGFMISNICEPKPLPKMEEISPTRYKTLMEIPHFVIFKLWKPTH